MTTQRSDVYGDENERMLPIRDVAALESPYQRAKVRAQRAINKAGGVRQGVQPQPTLPPEPTRDASLFADRPAAALPDPGSRTERSLLDRYAARTPQALAIRGAEERNKAAEYRREAARLEAENKAGGGTAKKFYANMPRIEELERLADRADRDAKAYDGGEQPFVLTEWAQEKYFEPAAGTLTYAIQKGIPVWTGEVEKRATELRKQGYNAIDASRLAYSASDMPWGVKGLAEAAVDPMNLLPSVGYGGDIARATRGAVRGVARGAAETAPRIGRAVGEVLEGTAEGQRGALGVPGLPSGRIPGGPGRIPPQPPPPPKSPIAEEPPFIKRIGENISKDKVATAFYDKNYILRELQLRTGIPVHDLATLVPGYRGAGDSIKKLRFDPILRSVGKDTKDFQEYMALRRVEDVARSTKNIMKFPGGIKGEADAANRIAVIAKRLGPERFARIEEGAIAWWRAMDGATIELLKQEGLLTDEAAMALRQQHPHYIPWGREDFIDDLFEASTNPVANVTGPKIKRLEEVGSERLLDKPLERSLGKVYQAQALVAQNKTARGLVASLDAMGQRTGETLVKPVAGKPIEDAEWGVVSYMADGVRHQVQVPRAYADVAKGLNMEGLEGIGRALQIASAPLRYGATQYNPGFLAVNAMRDAAMALYNVNMIPFGPDFWRGMRSAILKDATFKEAAESGLFYSGIVDTERMLGKGLPKLQEGQIVVKNPIDALLLPFTLTKQANVTMERATRLGAYSKGRRAGMTEMGAAVFGRGATVDFSQSGTWMRMLNAAIPFMNASVQGGAKIAETYRWHPVRSSAYAALFATPTILSRVNNMRYETSNLIGDREYERHWVWQIGEGKRDNGEKFPIYVKIPKGEAASLFSFPFEAMFHAARRGEDRSAVELLFRGGLASGRNLSPVDFGLVPPIPLIQTGVGLRTNVDPFFGSPIVPRREQGLLPEQQFGYDTSNTAIELGRRFKVSPRLIDFAIRDMTAGGGQASNWMISAGMGALGYKPEMFGEATADEPRPTGTEAQARKPFVRSFVGVRDTQLESRGYAKYNAAVESSNREFNAIPQMNALGVRLGEAGDVIDLIPGSKGTDAEITPAQRARHQELLAEIALPAVQKLKLTGTPEKQKEQVQKALTKARAQARDKLIDEIEWPKNEQVQALLTDRKTLKPYLDVGVTLPLPPAAIARRRLAMRDATPELDAALIKYGLVDEPRTTAGRRALLDRRLKEAGK